MALAFNFRLHGWIQLEELFRDVLPGRIEDLRPAFAEILLDFYRIEAAVYAAEGAAHGGTRWAPLSARYAARKAREYPGAPIEVLTGLTRQSLTGPGPASILEIGPQRMVFGVSWTRGRWDIPALQQTGTRKMPARPLIPPLEDADKSRWVDIIGAHIWEE